MSELTTEQLTQLYEEWSAIGEKRERERIIKLLIDLKAIRRDALGHLCAFNIDGDKVIYLPGLETK